MKFGLHFLFVVMGFSLQQTASAFCNQRSFNQTQFRHFIKTTPEKKARIVDIRPQRYTDALQISYSFDPDLLTAKEADSTHSLLNKAQCFFQSSSSSALHAGTYSTFEIYINVSPIEKELLNALLQNEDDFVISFKQGQVSENVLGGNDLDSLVLTFEEDHGRIQKFEGHNLKVLMANHFDVIDSDFTENILKHYGPRKEFSINFEALPVAFVDGIEGLSRFLSQQKNDNILRVKKALGLGEDILSEMSSDQRDLMLYSYLYLTSLGEFGTRKALHFH